jgi:superfamily II RNA helicase
MPERSLGDRLPASGTSPDAILDLFLEYVYECGLEPYPAQEEAMLELTGDRHVILATPTGSGKTLVANFAQFRALCEGQRSFYTAPTKALVNEKFFAACEEFGPERVGMLTGDASINPEAPVICCTTEVLANMSLRNPDPGLAPWVVMDEFHYYSDRDRGSAWQVPLLMLRQSRFLLMSATLGDTRELADRIRARSGREVAEVHSEDRPVPLDYEYRDTSIHETVEGLLEEGRAPIYVVHFTQREASERAQALTSAKIASRAERDRVRKAIEHARFDSPNGKEIRRFLGFGIGVHHAGLLPRYRLLTEQLSQRGLLKVVCGTDTLGVGVNIPIRTVLFSQLFKFDGRKLGILGVREFKQIAGRAGRKGFDDHGSVVVQAPERVIEARRRASKGGGRAPKKAQRAVRPATRPGGKAAPSWNRDTMNKLIHSRPEPLQSSFGVTHGMVINLMRRDPEGDAARGYHALVELLDASHESQRRKHRMRREAAVIFRSLRQADIVEIVRDPETRRPRVRVHIDLQEEFALDRALSLYLVEVLASLDPQDAGYFGDVLSVVEAIQDDPRRILYRQQDRLKGDLVERLKAEGVPYEERMRLLDEVTWPKPNAHFLYATFNDFAAKHPWVRGENVRPKGIVAEMFESYSGFEDYVRLYGIARSEGLLLRYLGDVYRTLVKTVPEQAMNARLHDLRAYLRTLLATIDSSLVEEWESRFEGGTVVAPVEAAAPDVLADEKAFHARVRSELHELVRALAERRYDDAEQLVRQSPTDHWSAERFELALAPYYELHGGIRFDHEARLAEHQQIRTAGTRRFEVMQVLLDPEHDHDWYVAGEIDLTREREPIGPLIRLARIAS